MMRIPVLVCSCRRIHSSLSQLQRISDLESKRLTGHSGGLYPSLVSFLKVIWHSKRGHTTKSFRASKTQANLLRTQKINKNPHWHVLQGPSLIPVHNSGGSGMTLGFQTNGWQGEGSISTTPGALARGWQVCPLCPRLAPSWSHIIRWLGMRCEAPEGKEPSTWTWRHPSHRFGCLQMVSKLSISQAF